MEKYLREHIEKIRKKIHRLIDALDDESIIKFYDKLNENHKESLRD